MVYLLIPLAVLVATVVAATWIHNRRIELPHTVHLLAFAMGCVIGGFFTVFLAGETMGDPGGWLGIGLVALWAVPMGVLMVLAMRRPGAATWILGAGAAALVGLGLWFAAAPTDWIDFEDNHGPIRAIALLAMVLPLTMLGRRHPVPAGTVLVVASFVPMVAAALAVVGLRELFSVAVLGVPVTMTGALLVLAGELGSRSLRRPSEELPVVDRPVAMTRYESDMASMS